MAQSGNSGEQLNELETIISQIDGRLPEIYERIKLEQGTITQDSIEDLVAELGIEFNYEFENLEEAFAKPRHSEDKSDVVNLNDITLDQLNKRIKNWAYEKIWETNPKGSLGAYIELRNSENEKLVTQKSNKAGSKAPSKPDTNLKSNAGSVKDPSLDGNTARSKPTPARASIRRDKQEDFDEVNKVPTDLQEEDEFEDDAFVASDYRTVDVEKKSAPQMNSAELEEFKRRWDAAEDEIRTAYFEKSEQNALDLMIEKCYLKVTPDQYRQMPAIPKEVNDSGFGTPKGSDAEPGFDQESLIAPNPEDKPRVTDRSTKEAIETGKKTDRDEETKSKKSALDSKRRLSNPPEEQTQIEKDPSEAGSQKDDNELFALVDDTKKEDKVVQQKPPKNFEIWKNTLFGWFENVNPELLPEEKVSSLQSKLQDTIAEYERILATSQGEEMGYVEKLLSTLKAELAEIQRPRPTVEEEQIKRQNEKNKAKLMKTYKESLSEIFHFYSKQNQMIGRNPGFDAIVNSLNEFNQGTWFKFLKHFDLMDQKVRKDRKMLTRTEGRNVFVNNARQRKYMSEENMLAALDSVAELIYDHEWDAINNTQVANETLQQKRERLYEYMGCGDRTLLRSKMQQFCLPFNTRIDVNYRLPGDDMAKNYKYKKLAPQKFQDFKSSQRTGMRKSQSIAALSHKRAESKSIIGLQSTKNIRGSDSKLNFGGPKTSKVEVKKKPKKNNDELGFLLSDDSSDSDTGMEVMTGPIASSRQADVINKTKERANQLQALERKKEGQLLRSLDRTPFESNQQKVLNKYKR